MQRKIMTRTFLCGAALCALAACTTPIPDSGTGVGFDDYASYEARQSRDAALAGGGAATPVTTTPAPGPSTPGMIGNAQEDAAIRAALDGNSGVAPVNASPSNAAPDVAGNGSGISAENDFSAVSAERSIQDDAAMIAQNRAQYQIIRPTDLPPRPDSSAPNIVEYALRTTNPVGTALYRRGPFASAEKAIRACAAYSSPDRAQEDFLASGGPERDRKSLDPDGDGFACAWDPAPFRAVRGS
ncbi:hypothetical protein SAMN04487993_102029 [Salipiger marinus]|uniref:Excalibur calcium-binding domain-containing protein n=2 Tax=Salipiger marinus TaxID=555512 RepID=A0A1G8RIY5_9RHOB|nr:hypothetical protein SAMN04487993_102029 [Salipiger marinus]